jgi:hypothetical protein
VQAPTPGPLVVGPGGGVVEGPGGIVAIGPNTFDRPVTVNVQPLPASQVPLAAPAYLSYVGGFKLEAGDATFKAPVQLAIPSPARPRGEEVYFLRYAEVPDATARRPPSGCSSRTAASAPTGSRRTSSPPYPGLSNAGTYIVTRGAQPTAKVTLTLDGFGSALGLMMLAGGAGGLAGLMAAAPLTIPMTLGVHRLRVLVYNSIEPTEQIVTFEVRPGANTVRVVAQNPAPAADLPFPAPRITEVEFLNVAQPTVVLRGQNFVWADAPAVTGGDANGSRVQDLRVVFRMGEQEFVVSGANLAGGDGELRVPVPAGSSPAWPRSPSPARRRSSVPPPAAVRVRRGPGPQQRRPRRHPRRVRVRPDLRAGRGRPRCFRRPVPRRLDTEGNVLVKKILIGGSPFPGVANAVVGDRRPRPRLRRHRALPRSWRHLRPRRHRPRRRAGAAVGAAQRRRSQPVPDRDAGADHLHGDRPA